MPYKHLLMVFYVGLDRLVHGGNHFFFRIAAHARELFARKRRRDSYRLGIQLWSDFRRYFLTGRTRCYSSEDRSRWCQLICPTATVWREHYSRTKQLYTSKQIVWHDTCSSTDTFTKHRQPSGLFAILIKLQFAKFYGRRKMIREATVFT